MFRISEGKWEKKEVKDNRLKSSKEDQRGYILGLDWKHAVTIFKTISPSRPLGRRWRALPLLHTETGVALVDGDCGDLGFSTKNKISFILD